MPILENINNLVEIGANAPRNGKINILYIYDKLDWAIYNVGKLWFENNSNIDVTYKCYFDVKEEDFAEYDIVCFGLLDFTNLRSRGLEKCIVCVHDPLELFPGVRNWKSPISNFSSGGLDSWKKRRKKIDILKRAGLVIVGSEEMKEILANYGIHARFIPTMGNIPLRDENDIKTGKCSILSVVQQTPRKNIELLEELEQECKNKLKISFDAKIGYKILPADEYVKLLDEHEIYVCTSFQEGGPLPAMEAMARGAVVLTTPVGQMPEIINDGENGFICNNKQEFIEKIRLLSQNLELLHKMRLKSREFIIKKRASQKIKVAAASLVASLKNQVPASGELKMENMKKCSICKSSNIFYLDRSSNICKCKKCGYVFDNPRPAKEEIINFYSKPGKYDSWLAEEEARDKLWLKRLKKVKKYKKSGKLLDIGAGIGQFLNFAKRDFEVFGTEVSDSAILTAKEKYNLDLMKGETENINFEGKKFDIISVFHVLEHVPDPLILISKLNSLLKKDGVLIIAVPNDIKSLRALKTRLMFYLKNGEWKNCAVGLPKIALDGSMEEIHLSHFTVNTLKKMFENNGFSIIDCGLDPYYPVKEYKRFFDDLYYFFCFFIFKVLKINFYDTIWVTATKKINLATT